MNRNGSKEGEANNFTSPIKDELHKLKVGQSDNPEYTRSLHLKINILRADMEDAIIQLEKRINTGESND